MPRHPPCALSSLSCYKDARVHCVVLKLRAAPTTRSSLTWPTHPQGWRPGSSRGWRPRRIDLSIPQDPTVCLESSRAPCSSFHAHRRTGWTVLTSSSHESRPNSRRSTSEQRLPLNECQRNRLPGQHTRDEPVRLPVMLLRKEVIQPHLPVRLPCYDFVPIARPTFDSSLRKRLGHWLRVLPTFVT